MMDYKIIRSKAAEFMLQRGWKKLLAKKYIFEQSLFEHSMNELDVLLQLLPILIRTKHFTLTETEQKILITAVIAHDAGKEKLEWQNYVRGGSNEYISHIDVELTKLLIPNLCSNLGFNNFSNEVINVIKNCVNLHMKSSRTDSNLISAMLQGSNRWKTLADLVDVLDNFCSAKGIFAALNSLERSFLAPHLILSYHQVLIRGVSTIFLHKAAVESFVANGWKPLLFYRDGTIYVASSADNIKEPQIDEIKVRLNCVLNEFIEKDVSNLIVGNPTANILPKPDLFDYTEAEIYLKAAAGKVNRNSFIKKKKEDREKVVKSYLKIIGREKEDLNDDILNKYSRRIDEAQPEMIIFKFFKAMMSKDLVGQEGFELAQNAYEKFFGKGNWKNLQSTANLMPAKDMAKTIDPFWHLAGESFGFQVKTIEELSFEKREKILIKILHDIAQHVYNHIPNPPSRKNLTNNMSESFIEDLIKPSPSKDFEEIVNSQLQAYSCSKPFAGKESKKGVYLCPICNTPFENGIKASANYLDNPQTHTNRAVSHGSFGYVMICTTCYYERIIRQILLGDKPAEMMVLVPRMNIGYDSGSHLVKKAREFYGLAQNIMLGNTENPNQQVSFAITQIIAKNIFERDLYRLTSDELVKILTYESADNTRKKQKKELEKAISEFCGSTVEEVNSIWETDFRTWEEAIEAVIANKVENELVRQARKEAYRLVPQWNVVCQTPNMILIPLLYPISLGKESDTNAALRKLFVSILIGLALDVTVGIVADNDEIDIEGGEGLAYVPPVSGIRKLIGDNWVSLDKAEKWFKAIGAASILAFATAYPERSNLYNILSAPTPGHILKRIEEKSDSGQANYYHIGYLEMIREVLM
jgi:hypothetical protein